jgi:CP family cyanate transporter-like MFS transporter
MLVGIGPLAFPLSLALINLRTRSTGASAALSGFVQSVGYTAGALGPLIVAVVHDLTRGWTIPLVVLLLSSLISIVSAVILARPRFVEDDLAERVARPAR